MSPLGKLRKCLYCPVFWLLKCLLATQAKENNSARHNKQQISIWLQCSQLGTQTKCINYTSPVRLSTKRLHRWRDSDHTGQKVGRAEVKIKQSNQDPAGPSHSKHECRTAPTNKDIHSLTTDIWLSYTPQLKIGISNESLRVCCCGMSKGLQSKQPNYRLNWLKL